MVQIGSIVNNLIPGEPVVITKIQQLGSSFSISYTGINSQKSSSKVIKAAQMDKLEVVTEEGSFNFKGDPENSFSLQKRNESIPPTSLTRCLPSTVAL